MIVFDLVLGSGAVLAPDATLRVLGHRTPSSDAREIFRKNGPVWLTFAAAHAVAAARDDPRDWWALAWLRGTEIGGGTSCGGAPRPSRVQARGHGSGSPPLAT